MHGAPAVVDQAGHPLINALFNPKAEDQRAFNRTPPAQQRERYLIGFAAVLQGSGYGHGGGGVRLPGDLFRCDRPADTPGRAAGHIDGAMSILTGIAANRSIDTGLPVGVADLVRIED